MSARVRRGEGQNLDSLLDTMANVTGILVVLMAVMQISVGDAMERLRDDLLDRPGLSREALDAAQAEAETLRAALAPLVGERETLEASRRDRRDELSALRSQIADLEAEVAAARTRPRNQAEAQKQVEAAEGRALDLEQALARERSAVTALEREIASLPAVGSARDARLPDARRAPPGASPIIYACRHGRVTRLDAHDLVSTLDAAVWRASRATNPNSLSTNPLLRAQVVEFFATRDVGDANLRWRVYEEGDHLVGHLEWRGTEFGESEAQIAARTSEFRTELGLLNRQRSALQFLVWDDSFEVYQAARKLADRAGFASGWDPFDSDAPLRHYITGGRARGVVID
jgi:hypothetical protein